MRLGLKEGWAGRKRKTAVCPDCSSDRARYSRRHYDGVWFFLFRVRPVKCSDCGTYFPVSGGATIRHPETDPADLHIPFRPSELDDPARGSRGGKADASDEAPGARPSRGSCPVCGSDAVHPSRPEAETSLTRRLDVKTTYRCARCNGSFKRTNPLKLLAFSVVLISLLAGLSYSAIRLMGSRGLANNSPRIKKNQVTQPPPPVFR